MNFPTVQKIILVGLSVVILGGSAVRPVVAQTSGVQPGRSSTAPAPATTGTSSANVFIPEIPIPRLFEGEQKMDSSLLANYIRAIYIYFIWVVGIVAAVMVVYGGIKWVSAAGNPGQIKDARDIIDSAVIGVIIALTSVVLLNIINPKLTELSVPGLKSVAKDYFLGATVNKICPHADNVSCGQLKETGKVTINKATGKIDPKGDAVTAYCMGTRCTAGSVLPLLAHENFCLIDKNPDTNFYTLGRGCVQRVELATPPPRDFANFSQATVSLTLKCSSVIPGSERPPVPGVELYTTDPVIGIGQCPGDPGLTIERPTWCYQVGAKAQVTGSAASNRISNVQCPPT